MKRLPPTPHCRLPRAVASPRAYLLVEMAVALGIIAVGLFAMIGVHRAELKACRTLARYEIALESAGSAIERLRAQGRPERDLDGAIAALDMPSASWLPEGECRVWTHDLTPKTPGLKSVRVAVSWQSTAGKRRTVELETLMIRRTRGEP